MTPKGDHKPTHNTYVGKSSPFCTEWLPSVLTKTNANSENVNGDNANSDNANGDNANGDNVNSDIG